MSDLKTLIHLIDRRQSDPKQGVKCNADPSHGRMVVRGDGATLLFRCGYMEPVSIPD